MRVSISSTNCSADVSLPAGSLVAPRKKPPVIVIARTQKGVPYTGEEATSETVKPLLVLCNVASVILPDQTRLNVLIKFTSREIRRSQTSRVNYKNQWHRPKKCSVVFRFPSSQRMEYRVRKKKLSHVHWNVLLIAQWSFDYQCGRNSHICDARLRPFLARVCPVLLSLPSKQRPCYALEPVVKKAANSGINNNNETCYWTSVCRLAAATWIRQRLIHSTVWADLSVQVTVTKEEYSMDILSWFHLQVQENRHWTVRLGQMWALESQPPVSMSPHHP